MTGVCILDYGSGNVRSVFNLFSSIADRAIVSNDPDEIRRATHIVLPGVGAFAAAMRKIRAAIPLEVLCDVVLTGRRPFLGICVGMQVLGTEGLEFGRHPGLGWIDGDVAQLDSGSHPLPHVGWNGATCKNASPLFAGLDAEADFYFVHSFAMRPRDAGCVAATSEYGTEFCSAVQSGNVFGVQFHPEKSQHCGVRLARNFLGVR